MKSSASELGLTVPSLTCKSKHQIHQNNLLEVIFICFYQGTNGRDGRDGAKGPRGKYAL